MKIGLAFRNEIMGLRGGSWIVEQFDSLVARISGVWQVEHNDDGTHADVTASSVDVSGNVAAETVTVNDEVTLSATTDTLSAGSDVRITAGRATFIQGSIILGVTPSALLTSQTLLKYAGGGAQGGLAVRRGDDTGAANLSALAISGSTGTFTGALNLSGASAGQIQFPAAQNASADANTLDDYEEGTFTGTLTGVSGSVTATVRYTKIGNSVALDVPQVTGTSDATTKTITGMPAAIMPAREKTAVCLASDNGGGVVASRFNIGTDGVITVFATTAGGAWTASGAALVVAFQTSYTLA